MQHAINPDTGDILFLHDNEWVKPEQVAKNEAGESAYLVGDRWRTLPVTTPAPIPVEPQKEATLASRLVGGAKQLGSSTETGIKTLFGSAEEAAAAAQAGSEQQAQIEKEKGHTRGWEDTKKAYETAGGGLGGIMSGTGEFLSQIPGAVAENLPQMGATLGAARLGAMVGGALGAPIAGVGAVPGAIIGGALGAFGTMFPGFVGSNVTAQAEEAKEQGKPLEVNKTSAVLAAAGQTALEEVGGAFGLGKNLVTKLLSPATAAKALSATASAEAKQLAVKELAETANRSLLAATGRGALRGVAEEVPVEVAQQILEDIQAGRDPLSPEGLSRLGQSAYGALQVGSVFGGAAAGLDRSQAKSQLEQQGLTPAGTETNPQLTDAERAAREEEQQTVGFMRQRREQSQAAQKELEPFIGQKETPEGQFGLNLEGGKRVAPTTTVQGEALPERKAGFDPFGRPKTDETEATNVAPTGGEATELTKELDKTLPLDQHVAERDQLLQQLDNLPEGKDTKAVRTQMVGRVRELNTLIKSIESAPVGTQGALPVVPSATSVQTTPQAPEVPKQSTSTLLREAGVPGGAAVTQQLKGLDLSQQADRTAAAEFIARALENPNVKPETKAAIQKFYDTHLAEPAPQGQGGFEFNTPETAAEPTAQTPPAPAAPAAPVTPAAPATPAAPTAPTTPAVPTAPTAPTTPVIVHTPETAPPILNGSVWDALGIGKTAKIRNNVDVNGKDITDPTDGAFARKVLETYRDATQSDRIKENIDKYLARFPESTPAAPVATTPQAQPQSPVEQRVASGQVESWALQDNPYKGVADVVYADGDKGLLRFQTNSGAIIYVPVIPRKRFSFVNIETITPKEQQALGLSDTQLQDLNEAKAAIEAKDNALLTQFPDGPFTDAPNNVVATENVDPRYTQYLTALMQKLGMGDINLFLVSGNDLLGNKAKYNLHGAYGTLEQIGDRGNTYGSLVPFGPKMDSLAIYLDPSMPLEKAIETLTHELGHGIEYVAFVHAPQSTKDAIVKDYETWKKSVNGMTIREFMHSLRNRESAKMITDNVDPTILSSPATTMPNFKYYISFAEWFADNSSRWATTDTKAISLVAKFFQSIAKQLRALAQAVTGGTYLPAPAMAEFLNQMGPANPIVWEGVVADTFKGIKRIEYENGLPNIENELIDADQISNSAIGNMAQSLNTPVGQITPNTWVSINQAKSQPQRTAMTQYMGVVAQGEVSWADWFRQKTVDVLAPVATKLGALFDQGVRNSFGEVNPIQFIRQAFDHARVALDVFKQGGLRMNKDGFWESYALKDADGKDMSATQVINEIAALAKKNNEAFNVTKAKVATILEGMRLSDMRKENATLEALAQAYEAQNDFDNADKTREKKILLHMRFSEIDALEQVFKASPEIQEIQRIMNTSRESVVDAMIASGRISKERGDFWKSVTNYVPFNRENNVYEDISLTQRPTRKGITSLGELPAIRGSLSRPVANTIDNYMNTMAWMVEQSMRNSAAVRVLNTMASAGMATKLPSMNQATDKHMVLPKLYENGEPVYFEMDSPYDFAAFVQAPEMKSGVLKFMGASSRLLRTTVTATPMFAMKQVIDDAQRVMFYSGVKNPTAALAKTLAYFPRTWFSAWVGKESDAVRKLTSLGIVGDYDFNPTNPVETLEYQTGARKRGAVKSLINKLEQVTKASDMASRLAVYEQTLKETNDPALAQTRARELINFNRRGSSVAMQTLSHIVPFFNAYAQGMDLLYRGVTGKDASSGLGRAAARKVFMRRVAMMTAMGSIYALAMSDDDQYEDLTDEVRDRNWILPKAINEGLGLKFPIKISVPTELGFVFKSIPERAVSYMKQAAKGQDQGVAKAVTDTLVDAAKNYGITPIPAIIKPTLENITNYSTFTHRELVPKAMESLPPGMQYRSSSSEVAKAIGKTADVSPIKVDNWIRGTFGLMGSSALLVADSMINPALVDKSLSQMPFANIALVNPAGSRVKDEFYEFRQQVTEAVAAKNKLQKENPAQLESFMRKNSYLVAAAPYINGRVEALSHLRAMRTMYENTPDPSISSAERRSRIDEINQTEKSVLKDFREFRAAILKQKS